MRHLQVLLVFMLLSLLVACGGGKASVTITVSPTTATVYTAQNQQFAATITNGTNNTATWEVNGVVGGNSVIGYIDGTGLYTAPAAVPNPATVTITAVSTDDNSKSATATVTVQLGANLSISPSSLTMNAGAQQTFTVTSNGTAAPSGVTFSLSCKGSSPGACGSVTTDGVYTAPSSPPPGGGNVILTASLTQGSASFSTSAVITVTGSSEGTSGQYAFEMRGTNNGNSYHAAGSFTLDGNGNITGGSEDINNQGTVSTVNITGGIYTYSPSTGRLSAVVATSAGNVNWYMVFNNPSQGFIEYAGFAISASGTVSLQSPTQFTLGAVTGNYAFQLAGLDTGSSQHLAEAGAFTADGSGNLSAGLLDANVAGTLTSNQAVTGTLTTPSSSTGRGTMTIASGFGTQTFAYYVVDATQFKLVEIDGAHAISGDAVQQTGSPYATGDIHGTLAMVMSGTSGTTVLGIGGNVPLSSGTIVGGSIDRNSGGIFTGGQTISGGSYSVTDATTGRTQVTINLSSGSSIPIVLYPQSDTVFNLLDVAGGEVASGKALVASAGTDSNATLQGNYSAHFAGDVGSTPEDIVGELIANGGGVFTGTLDITNGGTNTVLQSSPYSVGTTSTTTLKSPFANFNSVGFNLYIVDSNETLILENDTKGALTGVMQLQQ